MKRLFLLRHATALDNTPSRRDKDRELAPEGLRQASKMSAFFKVSGFDPECLLCSSAVRTRQTFEAMHAALTHRDNVVFMDSIYNASNNTLVDILEQEVPHKDSLLLIGHNPGIGELAYHLASSALEHETTALAALRQGYPTCALSVFEMPQINSGFSSKGWRLISFFRPS